MTSVAELIIYAVSTPRDRGHLRTRYGISVRLISTVVSDSAAEPLTDDEAAELANNDEGEREPGCPGAAKMCAPNVRACCGVGWREGGWLHAIYILRPPPTHTEHPVIPPLLLLPPPPTAAYLPPSSPPRPPQAHLHHPPSTPNVIVMLCDKHNDNKCRDFRSGAVPSEVTHASTAGHSTRQETLQPPSVVLQLQAPWLVGRRPENAGAPYERPVNARTIRCRNVARKRTSHARALSWTCIGFALDVSVSIPTVKCTVYLSHVYLMHIQETWKWTPRKRTANRPPIHVATSKVPCTSHKVAAT